MKPGEFGRLRWRLLAANLAVSAAGLAAAALGIWLAAPGAFDAAMGRAAMGGTGGGMMGSGPGASGMMDPLLRSAFGDAVGTALWLGVAAATVVAIAASLLLATRISRPIDDLAAASRRVVAGDYSRPVPPAGGELGELAASFNAMAASLAREEQRRRDLIGDVAHELRTPIASVRGYVEGLEAGVFAPGPEAWRVLGEQTERLEHLVDDLALLWRTESNGLRLEPAILDAAAELRDAGARQHAAAAARGTVIDVAPCGPLAFRADPARVGQVLDNLVANAIRYGRERGTVRLSASASGSTVVLAVADDGPGLSPDQLAHVFERFYRGDTSRARNAGGSGLGLAISRTLVEAMGGSIRAASAGVGTGCRFEVSLPAA